MWNIIRFARAICLMRNADQLFDLIHELEFNILGIPCPGHLKKTDQPVVKPGCRKAIAIHP